MLALITRHYQAKHLAPEDDQVAGVAETIEADRGLLRVERESLPEHEVLGDGDVKAPNGVDFKLFLDSGRGIGSGLLDLASLAFLLDSHDLGRAGHLGHAVLGAVVGQQTVDMGTAHGTRRWVRIIALTIAFVRELLAKVLEQARGASNVLERVGTTTESQVLRQVTKGTLERCRHALLLLGTPVSFLKSALCLLLRGLGLPLFLLALPALRDGSFRLTLWLERHLQNTKHTVHIQLHAQPRQREWLAATSQGT